jgi:hypothetical protein
LLVTAIVALVIVVWQLWQEVAPLRTEVRRLRNEVGELMIADDTKIYALNVRTNDDLTWKWRVYLPKNRRYRLNLVSNPVPESGYPAANSYSGSSSSVEAGEYVVEIAIRKDANGTWIARHSMHGVGESGGKGHSGGATSLDAPSEWLDGGRRYTSSGVLKAEQILASPDERLLLVRLRPSVFTPKDPDSNDPLKANVGTSRPATGPVDGLLIWIDDEDINQ